MNFAGTGLEIGDLLLDHKSRSYAQILKQNFGGRQSDVFVMPKSA